MSNYFKEFNMLSIPHAGIAYGLIFEQQQLWMFVNSRRGFIRIFETKRSSYIGTLTLHVGDTNNPDFNYTHTNSYEL